jgi:hypothetical protein
MNTTLHIPCKVLLFLCPSCFANRAAADSSYSVKSPDDRIEVQIHVTCEWRKPRNSGRGKPQLQRCGLLLDVAFDYGERCAAT